MSRSKINLSYRIADKSAPNFSRRTYKTLNVHLEWTFQVDVYAGHSATS